MSKLEQLALNVKKAWNKYKETSKEFGENSLAAHEDFDKYEDAEHELLGFIFDELEGE